MEYHKVEAIQKRFYYTEINKGFDVLLVCLAVYFIAGIFTAVVYHIMLEGIWGWSVLLAGIGFIFTLVLQFTYIGIVLEECV